MADGITAKQMESILRTEIPWEELKKDTGPFEFFEADNVSIAISWESDENKESVFIFNLFAYDKSVIIKYDEDGAPQYASEYINVAGSYQRGQIPCAELVNELVAAWESVM